MQIISLTLLAITGFTGSQLEWSQNYGTAKSLAGRNGQPLLVVLEDSTAQDTRLNEALLKESDHRKLLKNFKLCRIDVATDYGRQVAKSFKANQFPYTVMIDKSAKFITFRHPGQMEKNQWKDELLAHKDIRIAPQVTTHKPVVHANSGVHSNVERPIVVERFATPTNSNQIRIENFSPTYKYQPPVSNCPNCVQRPVYQQ